MPTDGSSSSRGSTTSATTTSWRCASRRSGAAQVGGPAGPTRSLTTTTSPRRRGGDDSACSPSASDGPAPSTGRVVVSTCSSASTAERPARGGRRRSPSDSTTAPRRSPGPLARCPTAAASAIATSRFSERAVPNDIDGVRSTSSVVSSSRSATDWRTWGACVRAVTAQSMRRTSSPGLYARASAGSVPGPGRWPRWSPCSSPSSRVDTCSASRRTAAGEASGGAGGGAGRRLTLCPSARSRCPRWRVHATPRPVLNWLLAVCDGATCGGSTRSSTCRTTSVAATSSASAS